MNWQEEELISALGASISSGKLRAYWNASEVFAEAGRRYPAGGSGINWSAFSSLPDRIYRSGGVGDGAGFQKFFQMICGAYALEGSVAYVGDSLDSLVIRGDVDCMIECADDVVAIPQSHYFWGDDFAWCVSYSFEGDMDFGMLRR